MMLTTTRQQRRALERVNAKLPRNLVEVPREQWPVDLDTPTRLRVFRSRDLLVQEFEGRGAALVRLSVNVTTVVGGRWQDGLSWEALQEVKDTLGYASNDAVEVYPRASDVVNVANMRHLWVLRDLLPFAWQGDGTARPNVGAEPQIAALRKDEDAPE